MGIMTTTAVANGVRMTARTNELLTETNALLTELLAEAKHANELTRWQIEQQKVTA